MENLKNLLTSLELRNGIQITVVTTAGTPEKAQIFLQDVGCIFK